MLVQGNTRVSVIIGHPIGQVKSPGLFNAHCAAQRLDRVLVPADLAPEQLPGFLAMLRGWHNADGCVVTVPYKRAVVPHLDALTERAERLQAVNVIRREADGRLLGDHLDGFGFITAAAAHGFNARGAAALVVGAGGVGSAIADALCEAGLARLVLTDANPASTAWLAPRLRAAFPGVLVETPESLASLAGFALVANATPVGMGGTEALPMPAALLATLAPSTLVTDVVTQPVMTPLLRAAAARGCRVQQGPEMAAAQLLALGRFMRAFP